MLIIGDPHFKIDKINYIGKLFDWINDIVNTEEISKIVFLGDMFHTHSILRSEILSLVYQKITELAFKKPVICLVGNHDYNSANNPTSHSLETFKHINNVTIVDIPIVIEDDLYIPYIHSSDKFLQIIAEFSFSRIFCHQLFKGANMGFIKSEDGVDVNEIKFPTYSGHIHRSQRLGSVYYIGTPYSLDGNDDSDEKSVIILKNNNIKEIISPFISIKKLTVPANELIQTLKNLPQNLQFIIMIEGSAQELNTITNQEEFKKIKTENIIIKRKSLQINSSIDFHQQYSLEFTIEQYIYNSKTNLDKSKLLKKVLEYLN
jgi:DNA repair exonuclease SbcCD nuclease subunit